MAEQQDSSISGGRRLPMLLISRNEAQLRFQEQVNKLDALEDGLKTIRAELDLDKANDAYETWHAFASEMLKRAFDSDEVANEFTSSAAVWVLERQTLQERIQSLRVDMRFSRRRLLSIIERLALIPESELASPIQDDSAGSTRAKLETILTRFHRVARQLQHRHNGRSTLTIEDEFDVQDLLHALLRLFFDDIRPEEWTPSYAGGSSRVDFLLKTEKTFVEVKKTRASLTAKEIGEQLSIDIAHYQAHPECRSLFCFVYDPEGHVRNPTGLENDLNRETNGLPVKVYVIPKA